jgi:Outer membrane protein beta-barrel domain
MKKTLLLASAIAMASSTAFAQSSLQRFYIGGGTGMSKIAGDLPNFILPVPGATSSSVTFDSTDTPARLFAGFRLTPHWSIEGGALSLGRFEAKREVILPAAATYEAAWSVRGGYADILFTLPIGDFIGVSAKVGALGAQTRLTSTDVGITSTRSGKKFAFRYGVAVQADLNRWIAFRADAEVNKGATNGNLGNLSTSPLDYNVFTGSLVLKF